MFWNTKKSATQMHMKALTGERALVEAERVTKEALQGGSRRVSLSLSGVRACDASGVAALVRMHGALASRGMSLELSGACDELARKFWGLGLGRIWGLERPTAPSNGMVAA